MKFIPCIFVCFAAMAAQAHAQDKTPETSFYDLHFTSIDGKQVDFAQFKGKKVLIVNTASKCGYTPQYAGLQQLAEQYKNELVIIGFPSNDFGKQEPASNGEIAQFCQVNYGVTFLLMEKSPVKGADKNVVYQWLSDKDKNGWNTEEPTWNFCKYLVDENGVLQKFFSSKVDPLSDEMAVEIEK